MPPWVVREYVPSEAEPVFESAEFADHESAVMYADAVARALATLYGNPRVNPVLKRVNEECWLVNMDYPNRADHNYTSIKVVESSKV